MVQVYFDHNATTPLDDGVLAAMMPYMQAQFGNPSSRHGFGRIARQAVEEAR
ncbi:MAG: aminotransferase class V-fold PLP-dependent enzyme, partial [Sulfurimicrobium sp.]|nr:aminotransferase class V-fold PLP-dependent enzyme [Sulfurimicrobium sp.]